MRVGIGSKSVLNQVKFAVVAICGGIRGGLWAVVAVVAVLGLTAVGAPAQAVAQEGGRLKTTAMMGSTVSVATLRIPEKAWRHFDRAKEAAKHNRSEEFDRESLKAIEIAPGFAEAYLLRANQQERTHDYEAAIANVQRARAAEPDVVWAGVILAGAFNGLGRYNEAKAVLETVHGAEAESWQARYELARSATGNSDSEAALQWSAMAMEGAPAGFADMHIVRANALMLAHRWSEASTQLEFYLGSKGPQSHREQVTRLLLDTKQLREAQQRGQTEGNTTIALR